jgi:hypothetical protein
MTAKRPVGNTPALFIESSHNWPCQNQLTGLGRRPFGFRQGKVMESCSLKGGLRSCLQEQATEIPEHGAIKAPARRVYSSGLFRASRDIRSCLQEQATEIPETRRLHAASVEGTAPLIRRSF